METNTAGRSYRGALHAEVSVDISAAPQQVMNAYLDYANWHRLFPLTIAGTRLVKREGEQMTIEVSHKKEGKVINLLSILSKTAIRLEEFKHLFNAIFINRFEETPGGTRYTIIASVALKGPYRLLQPFVKWLVKGRMRKYVLDPMKEYFA
jgi:Polyketide cyclase / dehydrase and lipid transport